MFTITFNASKLGSDFSSLRRYKPRSVHMVIAAFEAGRHTVRLWIGVKGGH